MLWGCLVAAMRECDAAVVAMPMELAARLYSHEEEMMAAVEAMQQSKMQYIRYGDFTVADSIVTGAEHTGVL